MKKEALKINTVAEGFQQGRIGYSYISSERTGRYTLKNTAGEIVDNSSDAQATKVWIDFEGHSKDIQQMIIADNGLGMNEEQLLGSFTLGCERKRQSGELGKFGIGGTKGSLGIAGDKLTITRDSSGITLGRRYSIDSIRKNDSWGTIPVKITKAHEKLLNSYVGEGKTGTVIVLSNFDRDNFSRVKKNMIDSLENYLSKTYCEIIAQGHLEIILNGDKVETKDPLCWWRPETRKVVDQLIEGTNIRIRVVDLRDVDNKHCGSKLKNMGGYVFRCNRLIQSKIDSGHYYWGSRVTSRHGQYDWLRWGIYFDDDNCGMNVSNDKSETFPNQSLLDKIQAIIKPEAQKIWHDKLKKDSVMTPDEEEKRNELIQEVAKTIGNPKPERFNLTSKGEKVDVLENTNVVNIDNTPVKLPAYVVKNTSLGQGAECAHWIPNPDEAESSWILQINTDHRYIQKYYLQTNEEVQDAVVGWLLPYYITLAEQNQNESECNLYDLRDLFNRKIKQAVSKIDKS
jgi:hypothetical protein